MNCNFYNYNIEVKMFVRAIEYENILGFVSNVT